MSFYVCDKCGGVPGVTVCCTNEPQTPKEASMALTPEQIDRLIQQADGLAPKEGSIFRALVKLTEAEVRKQLVPLTEAQRNAIYDKHCFIGDNGWEINWWQVVDEVEAAHGIGIKGGRP